MTQRHFRLSVFLFFIIIITISSCKGQDTSEKQSEVKELGEVASINDDKIWKVFQDSKGHYWFGSNGDGVLHYDGKNLRRFTTKDGLNDNQIRDIQEDEQGILYIGTPKGISKYDGNSFSTLKVIKSPSNEWKLLPTDKWFHCVFNQIYRYDGEFLYELHLPEKDLKEALGTEPQGLSFVDMNSSPFAVYGINKDSQDNLWIGTIEAGAFRYDGKSFLWVGEKELSTLPDGRVPGVRSMLEDKNGYMWLSNFKSKYQINETTAGATYEKLEGIPLLESHFKSQIPYFNSGLTATNGDLWMTTYTGGVWKYNGEKLINFEVTDGETEALLTSIYEDNNGVIWLGTDNAGVFKFNGETFERFDAIKN